MLGSLPRGDIVRVALEIQLEVRPYSCIGLAPVVGEERWEEIQNMQPQEEDRYSRHTGGHRM